MISRDDVGVVGRERCAVDNLPAATVRRYRESS